MGEQGIVRPWAHDPEDGVLEPAALWSAAQRRRAAAPPDDVTT